MPVATGPTQGDYTRMSAWKPRPWVARVISIVVKGGPYLVATVVGLIAARVHPRPDGLTWLSFIFVVVASSQLSLRASERAMKRLLPLPTLLRFSLVFPDKAPQRFSTALRTGNVEKMRREMDKTAKDGLPADVNEAAVTALRMVAMLNEHDRGTRGHSERVRAFTEMLAEEMGLDEEFRGKLRWGALLHDMGKLAVPPEILNKPGRPTPEEWSILQTHPAEGGRILAPLADWLGDAVNAAAQHHERWDGKGYPAGLAGEEISLSARIVAVADAFAVMTAARSYKKPLPLAVAREELTKHAGTQFDPVVVRAMLSVSIGKTSKSAGTLTSLANLPYIGSIVTASAPASVPGLVSSGAAAAAITASMVVPSPATAWVFDRPVPFSDQAVATVDFDSPVEASGVEPSELALSDSGVGEDALTSPSPTRSARPLSERDPGERLDKPSASAGVGQSAAGDSSPQVGMGENAQTPTSTLGSLSGGSVTASPTGLTSIAGVPSTVGSAVGSTAVSTGQTTVPDPNGTKPRATTTVPTTLPTTLATTLRTTSTAVSTTRSSTTTSTSTTTTLNPNGTKPPQVSATTVPTTLPITTVAPSTVATTVVTTLPATTPTTLASPTTINPDKKPSATTVDTTPPIIATTVFGSGKNGNGNANGSGNGNGGIGNGNGNGNAKTPLADVSSASGSSEPTTIAPVQQQDEGQGRGRGRGRGRSSG